MKRVCNVIILKCNEWKIRFRCNGEIGAVGENGGGGCKLDPRSDSYTSCFVPPAGNWAAEGWRGLIREGLGGEAAGRLGFGQE